MKFSDFPINNTLRKSGYGNKKNYNYFPGIHLRSSLHYYSKEMNKIGKCYSFL